MKYEVEIEITAYKNFIIDAVDIERVFWEWSKDVPLDDMKDTFIENVMLSRIRKIDGEWMNVKWDGEYYIDEAEK